MIKESQVFVPDSDDGFEKDDKLTVIGWLRKLYLFAEDGEHLEITTKSRKIYDKAVALLLKYGKIKEVDVYTCEEKTKVRQQTKLLKKVIG